MKLNINLRTCIISVLYIFVFCCMVFFASAEQIETNDFFDFDKYSSYELQGDYVYVTTTLPDWYYTEVRSSGSLSNNIFYGDIVSFQLETYEEFSWFEYYSNPFGITSYDVSFFDNAHFFDLDKLPAEFNMTGGLEVDIYNSAGVTLSASDFYARIVFVSAEGEFLGDTDIPANVFIPMQNYMGVTFTINSDDFTIPDRARGFFVYYYHTNYLENIDTYSFYFEYLPFTFSFYVDNAFINFKNQQIVRDELSNINKALNDLPGQIGDEFDNVIEQEKEESKQEGNKFVDQVLDKLPDPSQGVLSALGELTSAVGYTGTEAVIPFPAIVVPGIDGLFDEIVIYDGSDFDLGSCVSYIPENILTVIQSLFTIAIVLYCVYELKGIISFIFTLKEKNNG